MTGWEQVSGEWEEQQTISWEKDVEDWVGASVWRVGGTADDILGEGCGGLGGSKCLESGTNSRRYLGRRMWRTGWGQVSGEWDEQQKISWGKDVEDWMGQVSGEWDEQQKISWGKDVEDWMGAIVWRVGRTAEDILGEGCGGLDGGKCLESGMNSRIYLGGRMWRTGWGHVSGEWDEQQKISWGKDVEDWVGASVWRVGRTAEDILGEGCGGLDGGKCLESGTNRDEVGRRAEDILGEGCGGLDGGKCLESGTNSRRYLGRRMWRTGWEQVSGEWDEQQKIS